jgi:DNA-binding NarL/FixJ family response regulator
MAAKTKAGRKLVRVLIADTTRQGCELLAGTLKRSRYRLSVVACATTAAEVRRAVRAHEPHVLITNANLQDGDSKGLAALRAISAARLNTRTVVLLDAHEKDLVLSAFRQGAKGVFCRRDSVKELPRCIRQVHNGQVWTTHNDLQLILEALVQSAPALLTEAGGTALLTRREEQVTRLVAEGLSNREISERLRLTEHTVKNYLSRVFDKLDVSNRVELIRYVMHQRDGTGTHGS